MSPPVFRLVLCASLFGLWMGYLAYLVSTRPRTALDTPLVLSRPQLMSSEIDVVAKVDKLDLTRDEIEITIGKVLHPKEGAPLKEGDKIVVRGLNHCQMLSRGEGTPKGTVVLTPKGIARVAKAEKAAEKDEVHQPTQLHVTFSDGTSDVFADTDVLFRPDWIGDGEYLVPLRQERIGGEAVPRRYEVAAVPASPGFGPLRGNVRIYPWTAEAMKQYEKIRKAN